MPIHTATVTIEDNGEGCSILVNGNLVATWAGDGIASDTVLLETPALIPMVTTTAQQRCIGMVLDMVSWEVLSAILAGPGDGRLVKWCEAYPEGDE